MKQLPTKQEMFDNAYLGILRQGGYSMKDYCCLYNGPDGSHCAAALAVPDAVWVDGKNTLDTLIESDYDTLGINDPLYWFIQDLQEIHDRCAKNGYPIIEFKAMMRQLARGHNLSVPSDK